LEELEDGDSSEINSVGSTDTEGSATEPIIKNKFGPAAVSLKMTLEEELAYFRRIRILDPPLLNDVPDVSDKPRSGIVTPVPDPSDKRLPGIMHSYFGQPDPPDSADITAPWIMPSYYMGPNPPDLW
jgi:hypothetical protein